MVREDFPENRALHPSVHDVGPLGALAAGAERHLEVVKFGIDAV
jgi:hypothetical protein